MAKDIDISNLPSIPKEEDISALPSIPAEALKEDYSTIQQTKDLARTVAQGAALGFSDEAIAMARSILEKRKYEDVVKEEREALERYSKEYPTVSTLAELGGGFLPALATGGGSAAATAARTGAGAAAKIGIKEAAKMAAIEGAKFGGITALGKTEDLAAKPIETAKEVAVSAATGGLLGGALGGTGAALPKVWDKLVEYFPRSKTAYEYSKATGKAIADIDAQSAGRLERTAEKIAQDLRESQKIGSQRIGRYIDKATEAGERISKTDLEKSGAASSISDLASSLEEVLQVIPSTKKSAIENLIKSIEQGVDPLTNAPLEFTPSEIYSVRKILSETYNNLTSQDVKISGAVKQKMVAAEEALRKTLEDKLPHYDALNKIQHQLYNSFENVIDQSAVTSPVGYTKRAPNDKAQNKLLTDGFRGSLEKAGLVTKGADPARIGLSSFEEKLKDVYIRDKELLEKGIISPEESMFAILKKDAQGNLVKDAEGKVIRIGEKDPETLFKTLKDTVDLEAAKYGAMGQKEVGAEQLKGMTDVLGNITSERGMIKVASYFGKRKFQQPEASKTLEIFRDIYSASPKTLGHLSGVLLNDPETRRYGESLRQAEIENNQQKKNAALFAAMQNPKSRQMIADSQLSQQRKPASDLDERYQELRNKFIVEQESGPEAAEKEEFTAYSDTGGKRTIGHGYNIDAPGQYSKMKSILGLSDEEAESIYRGEASITKEQADKLLSFSVSKAEKQLDKALSETGDIQLSPNQRTALVSMMYNSPKLIGPKILNALKTGDYEEVARLISISSDWQRRKHPGLPKRRRKEAKLFASSSEEEDSEV